MWAALAIEDDERIASVNLTCCCLVSICALGVVEGEAQQEQQQECPEACVSHGRAACTERLTLEDQQILHQ